MKDSLKKLDFIKGEMVILDLTFLFYLMRSSIPFFKYPFLVLYGCLIIYSLIKKLIKHPYNTRNGYLKNGIEDLIR